MNELEIFGEYFINNIKYNHGLKYFMNIREILHKIFKCTIILKYNLFIHYKYAGIVHIKRYTSGFFSEKGYRGIHPGLSTTMLNGYASTRGIHESKDENLQRAQNQPAASG